MNQQKIILNHIFSGLFHHFQNLRWILSSFIRITPIFSMILYFFSVSLWTGQKLPFLHLANFSYEFCSNDEKKQLFFRLNLGLLSIEKNRSLLDSVWKSENHNFHDPPEKQCAWEKIWALNGIWDKRLRIELKLWFGQYSLR